MTDPHEPDRNPPEQPGGEPRADWRGEWEQAPDGSSYHGAESQPIPEQREHHEEGHEPEPAGAEAAGERPAEPAHERANARPTEQPHGRPADEESAESKPHTTRSRWTTVGFVVVAGLLVAALVRAVTGAGNQGAINPSGPPPMAGGRPPIVLGSNATLENPPAVTLDPGLIRQGGRVGITGIGFDPGSFVDLQFTPEGSNRPIPIPGSPVARDGSFTSAFVVPQMPNANSGLVTASQRGSRKIARADAPVQAGVGFMALSYPAGRPGDTIGVTANGFQPGERIDAYWGRIGGPPAAQLQADQNGGLLRAPMRIGMAPAGGATLILVGEQSQTTATSSFSMIGLYPSVGILPYSIRAGQTFAVGGNGFMPGERVLLYVNNSFGPPVRTLQADPRGIVGGASFIAPYRLKGRQMLILIGEESRATATTGFQIQPYSPMAQPSTWGGRPGTTLSFYAHGFAPNEVVLVYANRGPNNPGELVSAFRADARGNAIAAGHYRIPSTAQGLTSLQLVGRQSEATATATLSVQGGGVNVPPSPPYVLPPELATDPPEPGDEPAPPPPANNGPH